MRALVTGLIVTVIAQAALSGVLSPMRTALSGLWSVGPDARNLMLHMPEQSGLILGVATLALAGWLAIREKLNPGSALLAMALGATVAYVAPSKSSSVEPVLDASSRCLTAAEVAAAWKAGTDNSCGNSKEQLCEASLRIAAGESWDTPQCPGLFDSSTEDVANNRGGLWQIISQTAPSSPVEQARMVYDRH